MSAHRPDFSDHLINVSAISISNAALFFIYFGAEKLFPWLPQLSLRETAVFIGGMVIGGMCGFANGWKRH